MASRNRYCPRCGQPTIAERRRAKSAVAVRSTRGARAAQSVAILFCGSLLAISMSFALNQRACWPAAAVELCIQPAALCAVGWAAVERLGTGAARASLPLRCSARDLLLAPFVGLAAYLCATAYVRALAAATGTEAAGADWSTAAASTLIVAPLLEEWLCRGVLFTALERAAGSRSTIGTSAALFALLHGLEASWLSVPHRLVGGLGLGWLRYRSGSILPGVVAHATWNALALGLA